MFFMAKYWVHKVIVFVNKNVYFTIQKFTHIWNNFTQAPLVMLLTYVISAAGIFCKGILGVIELADTHECKSFIRTIPEVLQSLLVYKKPVSTHIIQFTSMPAFKLSIMNYLRLPSSSSSWSSRLCSPLQLQNNPDQLWEMSTALWKGWTEISRQTPGWRDWPASTDVCGTTLSTSTPSRTRRSSTSIGTQGPTLSAPLTRRTGVPRGGARSQNIMKPSWTTTGLAAAPRKIATAPSVIFPTAKVEVAKGGTVFMKPWRWPMTTTTIKI